MTNADIIATILVGIITAAGALLGVWITQRHEGRRWYASYFLVSKLDALRNLYAALVEWRSAVHFYGNCPPSTLQEHKEKVVSKEDAYLRAMAMASLYLDDEAQKIMREVLGAFRQANLAIFFNLPDDQCPVRKTSVHEAVRDIDWSNLEQRYNRAVDWLRGMLNPGVLKDLEKLR